MMIVYIDLSYVELNTKCLLADLPEQSRVFHVARKLTALAYFAI